MQKFTAARAVILTFVVAAATLVQANPPSQVGNCPGAFAILADSKVEDWSPPQNIFGKSLPYMIPSAIGVLTLTQYFKHALLGDPTAPVFSEAFPITVANDTLTTLTSHWIATSRFEGLKRFLEGRGKDGEVGFWRRVGANTALNTTLISLTWLGAGMEVGSEQICGALGLCAVVYPTLQVLKDGLYKRLPLRRDVRELQRLEKDFPAEVAQLREIAAARAQELGVNAREAEFLLMTALEAVLTNQPVETLLSDKLAALAPESILPLRDHLLSLNEELSAFGGDLAQLNRASLKRLRALIAEQRKLRRQLINEILALAERLPEGSPSLLELEAFLSFGEGVAPEFSMALHRALQQRLKGYRGRIAFASVVDMSVAIGFFGGICLEATNFWAKTGEIPPILRLFADGG